MSQPCSQPEIVLFDARSLAHEDVRNALRVVVSRGVRRGAVTDDPDVVQLVTDAGCEDLFDFWLGGTPGSWPFERALALVSVEPERALFMSVDPMASDAARSNGLQVFDRDLEELDQVLP